MPPCMFDHETGIGPDTCSWYPTKSVVRGLRSINIACFFFFSELQRILIIHSILLHVQVVELLTT